MKTAIIHDWFVIYAGSERVVERIATLYPAADLYSIIDFLPESERHGFRDREINTSFVQRLPFSKKSYRYYLPIMPLAIQRFDLSGYDLIISSSHAIAKGVITNARQLHVCYCHTPMRYAWDLREQYLRESGLHRGLKGAMARILLNRMQAWDFRSAQRVDYFIANSHYIADRIKRAYARDAVVIYPPVNLKNFTTVSKKDDYYVTASRMVPYKKIDLIVETFSKMPDKKLVVIGDGPDFDKVKAKAGRNVEFLGHQPSDLLRTHLQNAKAFVFAADEDFGIVPVEAQACGTPVIAFGKGGSLETVIPLGNAEHAAPTGVFFSEQTVESLQNAVSIFETNRHMFDGKQIRDNALRFSEERFKKEFKDFVDRAVAHRYP